MKMIMETITVTIIMKTLKTGNNIKTRHREKKQNYSGTKSINKS